MSLSRLQFEQACKALVRKYALRSPTVKGFKGWAWNEHPTLSGFGYLSRVVLITRRRGVALGVNEEELDVNEGDDDADDAAAAAAPASHAQILSCHQYIVYSATFQVPAFYFTMHDLNGSPLPLSEIVQSSLFHSLALEQTEITSFALSTSAAPFPLLSQGEHPTTGQPCWYFHPCESAASVREVMNEVSKREWSEEERWLEAWMMVVGTVVNWTD